MSQPKKTVLPAPARLSDDDAVLRDGGGLRPTRDAFATPIHGASPSPVSARATFVAAPRGPRVAPAPRVVSAPDAMARVAALASARGGTSAPLARSPVRSARSNAAARPSTPRALGATEPSSLVVACVTPGHEDRLANALRGAGLRVRRLHEGVPTKLVREIERALRRAAHFATAAFVLGAIVGAVAVRTEALIPTWGWIPGPVIGACVGAGLFGIVGLVVGALASVAWAGRPHVLVRGSLLVAVEGDRLTVNEIAARVVAAGGEPIAHAAR